MARSAARRLWKPVIAIIAAVALSSGTLTTTATAAEPRPAAAPAGEYCGPGEQFYSEGGWTYTQVQVCLDPAKQQVMVHTHESQYYWGGAWYYASASYPAYVIVTGSVSQDGRTEVYGPFGAAHTSPNGLVYMTLSSWLFGNGCGIYTVTLNFEQNGPYWDGTGGKGSVWIERDRLTYDITVPCGG